MTPSITQAVNLLQSGLPICFPTETVYALAADATQDIAVQSVYQLKERTTSAPLSLMLPTLESAYEYALFTRSAKILARAFWPGPLTLILPQVITPATSSLSPLSSHINPDLKTIGIRIPKHPVALAILRAFGKPIVATSTNPSGQKEATTTQQIRDYFGDDIYIVDEGICDTGTASTIVDMTVSPPTILRQGNLTEAAILEAIARHEL